MTQGLLLGCVQRAVQVACVPVLLRSCDARALGWCRVFPACVCCQCPEQSCVLPMFFTCRMNPSVAAGPRTDSRVCWSGVPLLGGGLFEYSTAAMPIWFTGCRAVAGGCLPAIACCVSGTLHFLSPVRCNLLSAGPAYGSDTRAVG
jgi:hypothetical protein